MIAHTSLPVSDYPKSKAFYSKALAPLGYSNNMRLLYGGYPVEAYCALCDEFWIVSIQKRVELGEFVAAACGATSSPTPRTGVDGH